MKYLLLLVIIGILFSCVQQVEEKEIIYVRDSIRFIDVINDSIIFKYKDSINLVSGLVIETKNGRIKVYGDFKEVKFEYKEDSFRTISNNDTSLFYNKDTLIMIK